MTCRHFFLRAGLFIVAAFLTRAQSVPTITLADALKRAHQYGGEVQSADFAVALAKGDRARARADLLPTLNALNQFIYTEGTGTSSGVFVANVPVSRDETNIAHCAYLPSLSIDFFYGIDANQFTDISSEAQSTGHSTLPNYLVHNHQNLGYSGQVALNIPVWNWGAARSRVKQAQLALTLLRYQAGDATVLEIVDAQTTLVGARNAYADGLARYRVAVAIIQSLTGRL
ncbi:MAG TPA: TolC family protein [Bryobacteraceae bacterium]|nr:TolC family protein [Bryobacteraceae bacterium]